MNGRLGAVLGAALLLATGLTGAAPLNAAQQPDPVIQVRAGVHPDRDRLVFNWPDGAVDYTVAQQGDTVQITFSRREKPTSRLSSAPNCAMCRRWAKRPSMAGWWFRSPFRPAARSSISGPDRAPSPSMSSILPRTGRRRPRSRPQRRHLYRRHLPPPPPPRHRHRLRPNRRSWLSRRHRGSRF